tara:strand:- start:4926 stop:6131 length:1206 start_codon:yes stop_codon:yes gene_type:complete
MKILFLATDSLEPTGYAKIAYYLSNFLADQSGVELFYLAVNYNTTVNATSRERNPKITYIDSNVEGVNDIYGPPIIKKVIEEIKPDIFFIYNDLIVTYRNVMELHKINHKCRVIVYLDIIYDHSNTDLIRDIETRVDDVFVFSQHWVQYLKKGKTLPHWIDPKIVHMDKNKCRTRLNIPQDDFVIINSNRNSSHKQLDITIRAFLRFYKLVPKEERSKVKLFLVSHLHTLIGCNLINAIKHECSYEGISEEDQIQILNNNILHMDSVSDDCMYAIYNLSDVGINTASTEGFGLCNVEMGYLNKPQIVSGVGGMRDIYANVEGIGDMFIEPKLRFLCSSAETFSQEGYRHLCDAQDFTDKLYKYYNDRDLMVSEGAALGKHLRKHYDMNNILEQWWAELIRS